MLPIYLPIIVAGLLLEAVFIVMEYRKKAVAAVVLKAFASLLFVALGLVCMRQTGNRTFGLLVVLGLIFGAMGDVCLNLRAVLPAIKDKVFAAGIAVFLIGHLFYVAALMTRDARAALWGIPAAAVLAAIIIPMTLKRIDVPGKLKAFGIVYLVVVIVMFGCAAALCISYPNDTCSLLFAIGALLFMVSDIVLVFHLFGKRKHVALRGINLSLYYVGQLLIALCLLWA